MIDFKICDTHNDFLTELDVKYLPQYIKKCEENNVEIICSSYWSTEKKKKFIKKDLCQRVDVLRKENLNFLLHLEDLWWICDEEDLDFLVSINPFSCSLTWNYKNNLAGGTKSNGSLTLFGEKFIERFQKENIVVDVAHLNYKSFTQVTEMLKQHIYCSHTGFNSVKSNKRNLTDKQIDTIVASNGFVGLFFFDKCIKVDKKSKALNISDIVYNLKYFTQHWGFDNIGIGSDFYGIKKNPENLEDYFEFKNLYIALQEAGFSENQINKIFYKNFIDFYNKVKK